ncbi:MAG: hypothetical protein CMD28_01765 [Flavobacteriales bacterium]|jgi:hypothetical protein|nr:hypothetical protein [Flavobacteriales bacterium]|tara:strand:- start:536 stop:1381 length:846 start_codon:yes stop_codon:yes gene_type:complete
MEKELSLREIINEAILFFIDFRKVIIITTICGALGAILFQKVRPAYYNTTALVTSGLPNFERIDDASILNQRVAIDLINLLQLDIRKEDYVILSEKMNISLEDAIAIKSIKAEEIFIKDQDEKEHSTPKFSIALSVKDNKSISNIQDGLAYYFRTNIYIGGYYDQFVATTSDEINAINNEVSSLRTIRELERSTIDISSINVNSKKSQYDVNNQILELITLRSKKITDLKLLEPLSFIAPFTITQNPERGVLILGSIAAAFSFFIGILIAVFRNVYVNSEK